ncbi:MAG: Uma2 family endonuclease [Acetobacteraceae bacterium]
MRPCDMVALRKPPPHRMTVAEFLTWNFDDPSVHSWQLIDGEPVAMAPGSDNHGSIQAALGALLWNQLTTPGSRCRAVIEPGIVPRGLSDRNYRIPDIGVTCAPPSGAQMLPDPLILIEILSPSNETETWANVWTYLTIPTVMEVLIVNSTRVEAELLRRNPDGTWPEVPLQIGRADALSLDSIDFTVPLATLYRTTTLAMPGGNPP